MIIKEEESCSNRLTYEDVLFFGRFLINPAKDKDMRKWAVEGLSYLTLDAEVKEKLIEDRVALQALIDVAQVIGRQSPSINCNINHPFFWLPFSKEIYQ